MEKDCRLCKMQKKHNIFLDEDDFSTCVLNEYGFAPYHLMVLPKRHVRDLVDLNDQELRSYTNMIHQYSEKIIPAAEDQGAITWIHYGSQYRSQEHLHTHIISGVDGLNTGMRGLVTNFTKQEFKRKINEQEIKIQIEKLRG